MLRQSKIIFGTGRKIASHHGELTPRVLRKNTAQPSCHCLSSVAFQEDSIPPQPLIKKMRRKEAKELNGSQSVQHSLFDPELRPEIKPNMDIPSFASPSMLTYTGNKNYPITTKLKIIKPGEDAPEGGCWPVFRLMDGNGTFRNGLNDGFEFHSSHSGESHGSSFNSSTMEKIPDSEEHSLPHLRESLKKMYPLHVNEIEQNALLVPGKYAYEDTKSDNTLLRCYTQMVRLREMDNILQNAQRQGRISFYMTCRGEEAIHFGAASALELEDTVFAQYREAGLLMWRGFTLQQFADQCFSNESDLGKGRQMPVHYGSKALNYQTISSPLGTQIPQAAGAAYRLKLEGKKAVAVCFFGDGCASTTDFHSGLNFAATLKAPVIFFCRNNGYAISTSVAEQYSGDGIVSRAPGYGMAAIRVDGTDVFAVSAAVREARKYAIEHSAPVLIEAMSYRLGHHSTSDDSLRYRSAKEVQRFTDESDPLSRFQQFLQRHTDISDNKLNKIEETEKSGVIDAMRKAEKKSPPSMDALFTDVYHNLPPSLLEQQAQLKAHLEKYPEHY